MNELNFDNGVVGKSAPTDITDERGTRYYRNEIVQNHESVALNALMQRFLSGQISTHLKERGLGVRTIGSIAANAGVRNGKINDIDLQIYETGSGLPCEDEALRDLFADNTFHDLCMNLYNSESPDTTSPLQSFLNDNFLHMHNPRIEVFGQSRNDGTKKGFFVDLEVAKISI